MSGRIKGESCVAGARSAADRSNDTWTNRTRRDGSEEKLRHSVSGDDAIDPGAIELPASAPTQRNV